jgi:hypothetical protein
MMVKAADASVGFIMIIVISESIGWSCLRNAVVIAKSLRLSELMKQYPFAAEEEFVTGLEISGIDHDCTCFLGCCGKNTPRRFQRSSRRWKRCK